MEVPLTRFVIPYLMVLVLAPAAGLAEPADVWEERRMQCLRWLDGGYPSGIAERTCQRDFALPSAFLVKCARGLQVGFETRRERAACAHCMARTRARVAKGYIKP